MPVPAAYWFLAHQGGWDEILLFAVPVVLAIVGVRIAEKRGKAKRAREQGDDDPAS